MVSSRTSVPPRAVPERIRQVMFDTGTVPGFLIVITVLSCTPALLAWSGEKIALETPVTVCGGITVSVAALDVAGAAGQPLELLVTTQA